MPRCAPRPRSSPSCDLAGLDLGLTSTNARRASTICGSHARPAHAKVVVSPSSPSPLFFFITLEFASTETLVLRARALQVPRGTRSKFFYFASEMSLVKTLPVAWRLSA